MFIYLYISRIAFPNTIANYIFTKLTAGDKTQLPWSGCEDSAGVSRVNANVGRAAFFTKVSGDLVPSFPILAASYIP